MEIIPTPYNQLRQLLTDRLGHRTKFVTENSREITDSLYVIAGAEIKITNYQQDFDLQDILLAISEIGNAEVTPQHNGTLYFRELFSEPTNEFYYDLTKPLADQSNETLLALIELVK